MFRHFQNQWTPVLPVADLTDKPCAAELAGERIVLFRDNDDRWHALMDRCPHRGAALSLGTVTDDGTLRCGYHGWQFAGDGHCVRVPLNDLSDQALSRVSAVALPTRQYAGAVWVFTGAEPECEPALPDYLASDTAQCLTYTQEWRAHWTRAVENFIDFAHPPYLHEKTIGAYTRDFADSGGTARCDVHDTEFGMTLMNYIGNRSFGFRLDWYRPNMSVLHFGPTENNRLHVFSIPINENHTRVMTVRKLQDNVDLDLHLQRARGADHSILNEDRRIVESQHGDVLSEPAEISVATDAPSIAFRRFYREMIERTN